jgi:hypothetical protein
MFLIDEKRFHQNVIYELHLLGQSTTNTIASCNRKGPVKKKERKQKEKTVHLASQITR